MLIGEYLYSIDDKKRLSIPARFRAELGKKAVITRGIDNCLVVYPLGVWRKLATKLENLPSQMDARSYARIMLSGAMDAALDKLGRILIPDYLKEYAKLQKNVAILGLSNRIEIWDEKVWQEYKKKTETAVVDMAEKLKELGI
ncbi:MAG: cell division/cell wall cluster transcriptional repressor MraZ [Candidatus Wildermuthbacteria bacterium RIFCSPHIGHO2_01_FULL_47_27]|uniref:Transcriptional regulator MraZ n=2 Tax=Candidatus Wildermuthiibacteriota TaxID=1817923 RepID=A0A1G2RP57_9BACT|nr:MAG: Protein MraZ [Parcubacteria group bacterium GW2011_GWA2_47_9]OHA63697.1 MAG: cell division/cell wall cluster transcriptional repressor MraZ [Candidatus Wildermuthbacteria bacterium RIFCSPHIGHO2_01_FULL_47_27]OHA68064.1 MAG: cell division/cell wall cluster transcriptional repressor MraZ [Candidatus Wildermuthbacteria bacterium RIFCSPHIGHO2_02_FULL_47_17]OHA74633.1 MAG: cell division/cell wall cluster transcriptional repressor MraZ [Candidatus Wildermuthbacteria bacterium RIFCSPLOWO2_01_FU